MITLGVADVARATAFYESLGWRASSQSKPGEIAFFDMGGVIFGLYQREALAEDATVSADGAGFRGVAISHNAKSEREVDAVLKEAADKGATVVKPGQKVFWGGYGGYFRDPDGHLVEVAFNPYWDLDADGNVRLPQ